VKGCLIATLCALAFSGCASDVEVSYPSPPRDAGETGVVLVRFTEPMQDVSVLIDGVLVAEDRHTERVRVANVPTGPRRVTVVASAGNRTSPVDRTETIQVTAEQPRAILIARPPRSLGYWISSAITAFGSLALVLSDID
jgi:hypothetical protein